MLSHRYGPEVFLMDDAYLLSLLARIGSPETGTQSLPALVRSAYRRLLNEVLTREFPIVQDSVPTRMSAEEPRVSYRGPRLCQRTRLVISAVIRAGILPSQTCYEAACEVLPPANVRLDFLNMSREVGPEGRVEGVRVEGTKIGGSVDGAVVLIPDPMGATGGTVARAVEVYRELAGGPPLAVIALHLMVTPEAVRHLTETHPGLKIYSGRFDRGLSPPEVLDTEPGTHPELERGLNDVHYIVPGAGGMGELLTNSWV